MLRTSKVLSTLLIALTVSLALPQGALAAPYLTLNTFSGNPGVAVQVSGGGFNSGETLNIFLNDTSSPRVASAVVQSDSSFGPVAVTIPPNSPQGHLPIIGVGQTSGLQARNSYYVVPLNPSITVTSTVSAPFSTISINGRGFAPNEQVSLNLGTSASLTTANSSGSFTAASLTIPNVAPATYLLRATGQSSGAFAIHYFYVGGFYPSVSPSSYYILPSHNLSFSGSGFGANEQVQVYEGSSTTALSTFNANAAGSFSAAGSFAIPFSFANSSRTFNLVGSNSRARASATITVGRFFPSVYPSTYYVAPGRIVTFSGGGFANAETVRIYEGLGTDVLASFNTAADGSYLNAGSLQILYNFAGSNRTFRLVGAQSGARAEVTLTVGRYYPQVNPSQYYINPGQNLNLSGTGFAANETIDITLGGAEPVSATANLLGNFSGASITVPFTSLSMLTVTATGRLSQATATANITIGGYNPTVTPSSWYLMPGSSISFSGIGFAPNEDVNINSGLTMIATIRAGTTGSFSSPNYQIPYGATRSISYSFRGARSGATTGATVTIARLSPNVSADNYFVQPGSTIRVRGTGFAANESVSITAGSFSASSTTNSSGNTPEIPVTIPYGSSGTLRINITGQSSGAASSTAITLAAFFPQMTPSAYYALPGTSISFSGTGFVAGEVVSFTINGSSAGSANVNALGRLNIPSVSIPFGLGRTAHFVFTGNLSSTPVALDIVLAAFNSSITLSTYYAVGGTPITINGRGFAANENVNIDFGSQALGPATADRSGNFSLATNVPYAESGTKTVRARGATSGSLATTSFTQAPVYVSIQLGSYAGRPGTAITFIGAGYLPNDPIEITTDRTGSTVVHTFTAGSSGSFRNSAYLIPSTFAEGNLRLTIRGRHSLVPQSITFYVTGP